MNPLALNGARLEAIPAGDDLTIGAADAERERSHQDGAVRQRGRRHVVEPSRVGGTGRYGYGAHAHDP